MATRIMRFDGDAILRKKSKPVAEINASVFTLLDDMRETMEEHDGVGLSAPQVGVLKRIVIFDVGDGLVEMINPEIVETRGVQRVAEGCLSVPGRRGICDRPEYVKAKYTDRDGEERTIEGGELLAMCVSHELDHLDGVLFIDKMLEEVEMEDKDR